MSASEHDTPQTTSPRPGSGSIPTGSLPTLAKPEGWREHLRRAAHVIGPLLLMALMVFSAFPHEMIPPSLQAQHERLIERMRTLSLSQRWSMYAPNPTRGHSYLELTAYDADGTVRVLEETERAAAGWGTAWAWSKDRRDVWMHTVTRQIDKVNRNRTWYLRGVCVREARKGYDVRRIEAVRVYRSIRSPEQVLKGKSLLGPERREKAQDGSCRVQIIREMIEADQARLAEDNR